MAPQDFKSLFNTVFSSKGGLYESSIGPDLDDYNIYLRALNSVNNAIKITTASMEVKPIIYVNYINNGMVNAVAKEVDKVYYVGLYAGVIHILHTLFNRMLSSPHVLVTYGDATKEKNAPKLYNPHTWHVDDLFKQEDVTVIMPVDLDRASLADFLTIQAVTSLALHEVGHIVNGHVDYFQSENIFSWEEEEATTPELLPIEIIQTLEYDADAFSWNNMINLAFYVNAQSSVLKEGFWPSIGKDIYKLIGLNCFAMYSAFYLFGRDITNEESFSRKHLPAKMRREFMLVGIASLLALKLEKGQIDKETFEDLLNANFIHVREVVNAFAEISDNDMDKAEYIDGEMSSLISDKGREYLAIFRERWKAVRPLLVPHALLPLVPIVE